MSKAHGFRVYFAKAFRDKIKENSPVNVSADSRAKMEICSILERLASDGTHFTSESVAADGTKKLPDSFTVYQPEHIRDDLIHVEVSAGSVGSHEEAKSPIKGNASVDISKTSPEARYILTFLFPRGKGDQFVIIAQTKHKFEPTYRLLRRMSEVSLAMRREAEDAERAQRKHLRQQKQTLPPKEKHSKLLFRHVQAGDNAYFDELFRNAKDATVKFTSKVPSARGGKALETQRELAIRVRTEEEKKKVKVVAQIWRDAANQNDTKSNREGVSELAEVLEEIDLLHENEAKDYSYAKISLKDARNDSTLIAVDAFKNVFTYPVSVGAPDYDMHYTFVAPRVKTIASEARIEVDDIDAQEVSACLEDLAPATYLEASSTD
ncbi:hypothetical protein G7068_13860 [Leucobacter viscericola]|uniref:Uncharacterized protein n=1 Tax=Leucobacter viscericola TaxID=2714935 RepID=A0A6G7XHS2_9MICO|nr:hypothetical protein [Leucobacter viscericola]QIK64164.1 hypothetical protein G7068_13860 [Leucobacter viscericola]